MPARLPACLPACLPTCLPDAVCVHSHMSNPAVMEMMSKVTASFGK